MPHFLAPLFLAVQRLPKTMVQLIVQVLVQHALLLEYKPLVDWLKVVVIAQKNGTNILGVNPDPVLLAVGPSWITGWYYIKMTFQVTGQPLHLYKPLPLEVMCLLLKCWEL